MPNYVGKFLINEGSVQINDVYEYQHYGSIIERAYHRIMISALLGTDIK